MPVYHSALNEVEGVRQACGCAILPMVTSARGPAPPRAPPAGAAGAADDSLAGECLASTACDCCLCGGASMHTGVKRRRGHARRRHEGRCQSCRISCAIRCHCCPLSASHHLSRSFGASGKPDIVDEALMYFRANVFFKNFEIKGPADRVLVYLTLFTHYCLTRVAPIKTEADGRRELARVSIARPAIPGEPGWPLAGMFPEPANAEEAELCRSLFKQLRETLVSRLADRIYRDGVPDKFWIAFSKRRFMNKTLTG